MLHDLVLHLGQWREVLPVQELRKNTFFFPNSQVEILEAMIWWHRKHYQLRYL